MLYLVFNDSTLVAYFSELINLVFPIILDLKDSIYLTPYAQIVSTDLVKSHQLSVWMLVIGSQSVTQRFLIHVNHLKNHQISASSHPGRHSPRLSYD